MNLDDDKGKVGKAVFRREIQNYSYHRLPLAPNISLLKIKENLIFTMIINIEH